MLSDVGNIHDSRHLKELSTLVQPGDSTNIEGAAAKYYWSRVLPGFLAAKSPATSLMLP
ncbi:Uncharacterised protein [Mycobacteroides abscessus subsp. abscessus]|nr:Uncharacterised protein [Mycobacteroides abscessus subsp. abscessus]